jgi:hypothetical protein
MSDLKVVRTFIDRASAEMAKGFLASYDINAELSADDCGGAYPNLAMGSDGVKLLVNKDDYADAMELLNRMAVLY